MNEADALTVGVGDPLGETACDAVLESVAPRDAVSVADAGGVMAAEAEPVTDGVCVEVPDAAWLPDLLGLEELACEALAVTLGVPVGVHVKACEGVELPELDGVWLPELDGVNTCDIDCVCEGEAVCVGVGAALAVEDCVPVAVPEREGVPVGDVVAVGVPLMLGVPRLDAVCVEVPLGVKVEERVWEIEGVAEGVALPLRV